ncbi:uncharacterized protein BDR25DRAFT_249503 [Lindgomyces ingoldianus]|uniref:Uncharacterized protein n=1 Tax=Lindgomyces ingoldianus TaxID=673940 RepID=A0ACB6RE72_9PLEO|nr:uncharacterized protein BDR25DRAFT_249503 [Lindgomyces ingoldianus]KAF2477496.1 hypothetical protein BDR25DRAFT_249503 [Lindgomyces ingoldianus]
MSTALSNPSTGIDLDALIAALPACKRCRDCRRGCDTTLPKCRQCTKAGQDCIFFDHGRNEFLPRRHYIAALVDHVRNISSRANPAPVTPGETPRETNAAPSAHAESVTSDLYPYVHHFAYAGGSYRYLGAQSCLVSSPRLQQAIPGPPGDLDNDDVEMVWKNPMNYNELVQTYLKIVHPLYPILDPNSRFLVPDVDLTTLTASEIFALYMIYSIGCHVVPGKTPRYPYSGKLSFQHATSQKYQYFGAECFQHAMANLDASTVEPTIDTLRAVLLLAINSLFDPKSGNIGQQVALATRLCLDLELQDLGVEDTALVENMHSTIFSMENEIASVLDRPATFPEPSWELSFSPNNPSRYLCSLYRLQYRFRKGDHSVRALLPPAVDPATHGVDSRLGPCLRLALHQTYLLLNPCWATAWHVLESVVAHGCIHIYLTPHWVYRAGTILIQNMSTIDKENLMQLYSNALVMLEVSQQKWQGSGALATSLEGLLNQMKTKSGPGPDWGTLALGMLK